MLSWELVMAQYDYDLLIIGGGAAGLTAAKTAVGFGKRVAIVEKEKLGGECVWTGCVPSKALIKVADMCWQAKQLDKFGIKSSQSSYDTSGVMDHVRKTIQTVYQTHTPEKLRADGIPVITGSPCFIDNHTIAVDGKKITAKQFIIATGSLPFIPPIQGIDKVPFLTNQTVFDLNELPQSIIIIGGGPIGVELASAFNRLGVTVTLIEMQERIMAHEEPEFADLLAQNMAKEGVHIVTSAQVQRVLMEGNQASVIISNTSGQERTYQAQTVFIATGRKPAIQGLNLEKAGVKTTSQGIVVDATLKTSAKNIYACGDVVGPYRFSHMAWYQAVIAVRNACIPIFKKKLDYTNRLWVTFTAPELATAGLTEDKARKLYGDSIAVWRADYTMIDRGMTDHTNGLLKVITDRKGYILGVHLLGERAGDIIHELQLAKTWGIKLWQLQSVMHAYPTYAELNWHVDKKAYKNKLEKSVVVQLLKKIFM